MPTERRSSRGQNGPMSRPRKLVQLTEEEVATLRDSMRQIHDLLPHVDSLEKCGSKCDEIRADMEAELEKARTLLTEFGPGV